MSLFSVLKYPISSPPQAEELQALPRDLFVQWINNSDWRSITGVKDDYEHIAGWYEDNWVHMKAYSDKYKNDHDDMKSLKQLIRDYEEPE